ncbi:MAG TPA: PspC domain-containing protein [Acidimicrobiales bacterium]
MSSDVANDDTSIPTSDSAANPPETPPTRLRRSREHRLVAGVAGGIGERFDVNENLVRAIFMALTFLWGLGVAIYLVLWAVLGLTPADGDAAPRLEPTPRSTSHRLSIAILAALVVLAILAFSLARSGRLLAPGMAAAWIIFLVILAIIALKTQARRLTLRRFFAVTFLGGLSAIIVVVGAALGFLESTGVPLAGGNGNHLWQPTSLTEVARDYRAEFGVGTLDLSTVRFPTTGYRLSVSVAAGALRIVVPTNTVVDLTTNVGAGTVVDTPQVVGGVSTIPYSSLPAGMSLAKARRSPHVAIDARVGAGMIDLMRAP